MSLFDGKKKVQAGSGGNFLTYDKPTRTDLHCHECGKNFVALLDYSVKGNHVALCPHCGHEHFRVIVDGRITEDRWNSSYGSISDKDKVGIHARRVWKVEGDVLKDCGQTMLAREFLRMRWLEKMQ